MTDPLVAALAAADPDETVPLAMLEAMARAVRDAGWQCPDDSHDHVWTQRGLGAPRVCHCGDVRAEDE